MLEIEEVREKMNQSDELNPKSLLLITNTKLDIAINGTGEELILLN